MHLNFEARAEIRTPCPICGEVKDAYVKLGPGLGPDAFPPSILKEPGQLKLTCYSNPGAKNAIGVVQQMRINAPLAQVTRVLDDFAGYAELFPELVKVEMIKGESADHFVVKWTEEAPVFFMGNPVHELDYVVKSGPGRKIYRSSLKRSRHLRYSEGLIVLIDGGGDATWFAELDFYDADWSLLKILGSEKIWGENLRQLAVSDMAVKIKAENFERSSRVVRGQAEEKLDKGSIASCLKGKTEFNQKNLLALFALPDAPAGAGTGTNP